MGVPVLHVCDKFGVRGSSIHGVSRLFSWWFPRYDPARYEVSLCGLKRPEPATRWLAEQGIPVRHLGRGRFDPRILGDLVALARERGARILHVHGYAAADFGRLAARAVGAKLVLHEHFADPRMPAYQALADRLLRHRTDGAIAVSRSTREFLVHERFVPEERVRLIWNGAPLDEFAPVPRERALRVRRELGLPDDALVVGTIGRLNAQKGHRFLVDAAARLLPSRPRARVLIAGDGDLMADLRRAGRGPGHRRPRRLRRAPHRRARPARRARRVLHLVALRGHAARALRGDGGGQGDRLDLGGRLPRGAGGRRHGRAGAARPTRRPWRAASTASSATPPCARGSAGRRSPPRAATTCAPASTRCRTSTTSCSPAGGAEAMPLRRLCRSAREAWEVPARPAAGPLPPFVTGGELPRGDVPVFVFHGAEPDSFSRKLAHLAENGYVTLSADEYVAVLRGQRKPEERAVVLTFDDGRGSVWSVAAPLLRRHGMKAVVFLVPGRIASRPGAPAPTWDDVESGRADAAAVLPPRGRRGRAPVAGRRSRRSPATGLFDFQSHTLRHARVHTGPQLAGFVTPRSRRGYDAFDQPLLGDGERDLMGEEAPLGAPLLRSAPRTSEELRFHEDPGVRAACVAEVAESGGEGFFLRADWEARLRRRLRPHARDGTGRDPRREGRAPSALELAESRRLIEARTGRPVVHLCYPWHAAGPTARRLAVEAGYETAFCGKVPGVPITRPGGDPRAIARIGEDYVELLPGRGRATLAEVLRRKWARRFGGALR